MQTAIWPGFVDAMTGLLLVIVFVLTIFILMQDVLWQKISGQESELDVLSREVVSLANALGLERDKNRTLTEEAALLRTTLSEARQYQTQQNALIESIRLQLFDANARIADLQKSNEEGDRERRNLVTQVGELEGALSEVDAAAEALQSKLQQADAELMAMTLVLEEERKKAEETLLLLAVSREAEEDLALRLAAALAEAQAKGRTISELDSELLKTKGALEQSTVSEENLTLKLASALAEVKNKTEAAENIQNLLRESAANLARTMAEKQEADQKTSEALKQQALLNQQLAALRRQLGELQSFLDSAREREADADIQIESLGNQLNVALARAAFEERRRRELEEEERKRLESEREEMEKFRSEFFGKLRDIVEGREGIRIVGDRFIFSSEVLFSQGKAELSNEGQREIENVAAIFSEVVENIPKDIDWILQVDGHTDDVPVRLSTLYTDNWDLSQDRALSVVRYLIDSIGFPPERLSANGFGQYHPINPEDTEDARAQNRRIELKLTGR